MTNTVALMSPAQLVPQAGDGSGNVFQRTGDAGLWMARKTTNLTAHLTSNAVALGAACKVVIRSIGLAAMCGSNSAVGLSGLASSLSQVDGFVDTTDPVRGLPGMLNVGKDVRAGRWDTVATKSAFMGLGVAGLPLWMDDVGIITMRETASSTGGVRVFGLAKDALTKVANVLYTAAFSFLAIETFREVLSDAKIADPRTRGVSMSKNILKLVWAVSEVAAKALFFTGLVSTLGLAIAGVTAAGLGLGSVIYNHVVKTPAPRPVVAEAAQ